MRSSFIEPGELAWNDVLAQARHDFYHFPSYCELSARLVGGAAFAFMAEGRGQRFFLPLISRAIENSETGSRRLDASSPYGYPGPIVQSVSHPVEACFVREAAARMVDDLQCHGYVAAFVRLHPLIGPDPALLAGQGTLVRHGETVSIDLTLSPEELWRQTRGNHRTQIHRARRAGYQVHLDYQWRFFDDFISIYHETMARLRAAESYFWDKRYFSDLREALGERLKLFVVRLDDQMAAAGLFTEVNGLVQYHLGGTRQEHLAYQPTKLLFDDVGRWAKERGDSVLHLGGGVGGAEDSLYHFKAGFSQVRQPFYTWRVVCNLPEYERLVRSWELRTGMPRDPGNTFFPAYRRCL